MKIDARARGLAARALATSPQPRECPPYHGRRQRHCARRDGARPASSCSPSGEVVWGRGFGAEGQAVGEVCFHTAMTGYQEIMTDPLRGADHHLHLPAHRQCRRQPRRCRGGQPARAGHDRARGRDRAVELPRDRAARRLDEAPRADRPCRDRHARADAADPDGRRAQRRHRARGGRGVRRAAAARHGARPGRGWRAWTSPRRCRRRCIMAGTAASGGWGSAMRRRYRLALRPREGEGGDDQAAPRRRGRLRLQAQHLPQPRARRRAGLRVPATASFDEIMALEPDGFFLSNGPGDPAGDGRLCRAGDPGLLETGKPLFGICLGHQLLGLAVGATHDQDVPGPSRRQPPGQAVGDGAVEITSMNHGFAVERDSLPANVARDARVAVRRQQCGAGADRPPGRSACSTIPRRARGRRIACICSSGSWGCY